MGGQYCNFNWKVGVGGAGGDRSGGWGATCLCVNGLWKWWLELDLWLDVVLVVVEITGFVLA